jgi:membrane protease YdiL (CAAX protease family)
MPGGCVAPLAAVRAPAPAGAAQAASCVAAAIALTACAMTLAAAHPSAAAVPLLVAPIMEECLFRAGLQEWLLRRRLSPGYANVTTALAFTLAHGLARGVEPLTVAVLIPALALGWVYGRFGSLRLCIALHMSMNMAWMGYTHSALPWFRSL